MVIVVGCGLTTAFAQHSTPEYTIDTVRMLFARPEMIIHEVSTTRAHVCVCVCVCVCVYVCVELPVIRRYSSLPEPH